MLIGYARVSKSDGSQLLDLQLDALTKAGAHESRIYHDHVSGKVEQRPGLDACLKALQPGNTLVVWKLDRLGRDLNHLIKTIESLKEREVGFKVLSGAGGDFDTTTAGGKLFFNIFASIAEYERELIRERTIAGLNSARARGKKGGRPRKMDSSSIKMAMAAMKDKTSSARAVAKKLGITTATLYEYVASDGSPKEPALKFL
jgi:DNA invertase Pin-like site-specific DNA recombinase